MQKLIGRIKRFSQRGATLAGTVVLIVALTFMGLSLLRLAVNSATNETDELDEAGAFLAAESGVLMGARYLKGKYPVWSPAVGVSEPIGALTDMNIDGYLVTVTLTGFHDTTSGKDMVRINSEAYNSTTHNATTFLKRIRRDARKMNLTDHGTYIHQIDAAGASFADRTWNGPFHINEALKIHAADQSTKFTDRVTVASQGDGWGYGDGTHHNNNYDYGVQLAVLGGSKAEKNAICDVMFEYTYKAEQDVITLPPEIRNLPTTMPTDGTLTKTALPTSPGLKKSTNAQGFSSNYRPTLVYNSDGSATYYYKTTAKSSAESTITISNIDNRLLVASNDINVRGTVKGNSTLVTTDGNSIVLTGDLVYADFDRANSNSKALNYGAPATSTNMLGLVTGEHFVIPDEWIDPAGNAVTLQGSVDPGKLYLSASLLAITDGATELWNHSENYPLEFIFTGNHILDTYDQPSAGKHGPTHIYYNYDERLGQGLVPYGFPGGGTPSISGWTLVLSNWTEENNF